MLHFKPSKMTLALLSSGLMALSTQAFAAEEINADKKAETGIEVIQVTGIRGSLIKSINTKRFSSEVVESISAEDIGKLPDSSIAESIARLPGVAAQRVNGRASVITIRGLGEDFNSTTFNGREQVSIGDNRGVEFDLYPSEIINEVVVYKTPDSALTTQGIGGTVDMRSVRPLDQDKRTISFNYRAEKNGMDAVNPEMDNTGHRAAFGYIDQFADDTIGVAIAYSTTASPSQEERWNAWGYDEAGPDGELRLNGAKPYVRSSELKRDSLMGVLEFAPTDDLHITADALYIDFEENSVLRGIELPLNASRGGYTNNEVQGNVVTSGSIADVKTLMRNDVDFRTAEMFATGINLEYIINDRWSVEADISYSQVERESWGLESYAATGRGDNQGAGDNISYQLKPGGSGAIFTPSLDYSDRSLFELGAARSWGNDIVGSDGQDGFINLPSVEDELLSLKLAAAVDIDTDYFDSIQFGIHYNEREKSKVDRGQYLRLKDYPNTTAVPAEFDLGNVDLGFIGMGEMIAYDSLGFYNAGGYDSFEQGDTATDRWSNTWTVNEEVLTLFAKANISAEIGGMGVTGNLGLQVVNIDQSSDGYGALLEDGLSIVSELSDGTDYTEVLPAINLNFALTEDQVLRVGAARTMAKSRMDRMKISGALTWEESANIPANATDPTKSPWGGDSGNAALKPIIATQFDLSYEYYFSPEGYLAAAYFYKDIADWQLNVQTVKDFTGVQVPGGSTPVTNSGTVSSWQNQTDATVSGVELTATIPFNAFSDVLEGFGTVVSATFLDSELKDQEGINTPIPGLSEEVYSWTTYYERAGFQIRASMRYRAEHLGEVAGLSQTRQEVNVAEETLWDAQIGYDFGEGGFTSLEGLTITLQGQNLTDEPFQTYTGDDKIAVRDHQSYGRNFLLGFAYQF
ncbi:TonB-dependent receptor [Colwellia sp. 75C3]|uniref:TonB-dependent receptor n=1 Tax=Colwellia sp. 75C3 TaxID=888425 RepID=UPI000C3331AF|nr:TonB-dependent receptor [Colwellia sp. 75C3]PKG86245.1 TonB-dependent receptor [Colwellia sp. 75C3]